jgi:hypothetical protein
VYRQAIAGQRKMNAASFVETKQQQQPAPIAAFLAVIYPLDSLRR